MLGHMRPSMATENQIWPSTITKKISPSMKLNWKLGAPVCLRLILFQFENSNSI